MAHSAGRNLCLTSRGPRQVRDLWEEYYSGADAIVFMVDSADQARIKEAGRELDDLLQHEAVEGAAAPPHLLLSALLFSLCPSLSFSSSHSKSFLVPLPIPFPPPLPTSSFLPPPPFLALSPLPSPPSLSLSIFPPLFLSLSPNHTFLRPPDRPAHAAGVPVLILGNKSDMESSLARADLVKGLGVDLDDGERPMELFSSSLIAGTGYTEGFRWLSDHL